MGREFIEAFDKWADSYDQSVSGESLEYRAVFANYEQILTAVADHAHGTVLEFGTGTGNLTLKLLEKGLTVYGVEPSAKMREQALRKITSLPIIDGDFLDFPRPAEPIETIVSSFAFHHLTNEEKDQALHLYQQLLPDHGRIVFADTLFDNALTKRKIILQARTKQYWGLLKDLQTEYYPLRSELYQLFRKNQFIPYFKQLNHFVWLIVAEKETRH
ncbi:MAG: class I SAM-dependent methyltransferase [Sporolactobacillus sp.]|mgnify:CR=1 FL=1